MKLRNKKSIIRLSDPQDIYKKNINIGKYIYYLILIAIVYYLVNLLFYKTVYIEGNGFIINKKINIKIPYNAIIDTIYIKDGDYVRKNTPLFKYKIIPSPEFYSKMNNKDKLSDIELKIKLIQNNIKALKDKLDFYNQKKKEYKKLINMGLDLRKELFQIEENIIEIKTEIKKQERNLNTYKKYYNNKEKQIKNRKNYILSSNLVTSPIKGQITNIFINNKEFVKIGSPIVTIKSNDSTYIKGFFDLKYLDYIIKSKFLIVEFPNHQQLNGMIKNIFITTYNKPEQFQKKYEEPKKVIGIEIILPPRKKIKNFENLFIDSLPVTLKLNRAITLWEKITK